MGRFGETRFGTSRFGEAATGTTTPPGTAPLALDPWSIDGTDVVDAAASLTPTTLSLAFDTGRGNLANWRGYDRVGDFSVKERYGGGFRVLDTGGQSTVTVDAPDAFKPPFDADRSYYVASYDEQQEAVDRYRISLTLHRPSERSGVYSPLAQSGGDWTFAFASSTLALDAEQVLHTERRGTTAVVQYGVVCRLTHAQAGAVVDDAGTPSAVAERGVPDAAGFVVDTTAASQTVTITAPAAAEVADGDYAVAEWTLERSGYSPAPWRLDATLRPL